MKANIKPKFKERVANHLFNDIIKTVLDMYEKSKYKDTMSFEEYCRFLCDLSDKKIKGDSVPMDNPE